MSTLIDRATRQALAVLTASYNAFVTALAGVGGAALVGYIQGGAGAVLRTLQSVLRERVSVKDFGAVGDDATDDTAALLLAKAYAVANLPCTLRFPKGTYRFTDLGNLAYKGLTLEGAGHRETVLKCTSAVAGHTAIKVNAFEPGLTGNDATAPFVQACNLRNLTVQGNSNTAAIIYAQGLARSTWQNVFAREGRAADCIAFHLQGVMLSSFDFVGCSTDLDAMTSKPYEGLRMEAGTRAGVNVGNSSNNRVSSPYFEGLTIGGRLSGADQTLILGGSFESCSVYGLLVAAASRYNTIIGTGFENLGATADYVDAGISNRFINTYASQSVLLQGRAAIVEGGYFERIEVQGGATRNRVRDVTVNNWATGAGGFVDNGTDTEVRNVYDADLGAYITPKKDRTAIAVGASPFRYTNNTAKCVEVLVIGGTVTQILQYRGTDFWVKPHAAPSIHVLSPGDQLDVSYSVAPTMNLIPHLL